MYDDVDHVVWPKSKAWMRTGFFWMYILKALDACLPMAWMIEGGTPFWARDVAPPALSNCPAVSELKKCCKCLIKNDQVGKTPVLVNQRGELSGNLLSQAAGYARKCLCGSKMQLFFQTIIVFPSKNLSALWPVRKNWKEVLEKQTDVCLVTFQGSQSWGLSG